jgi:hypothetical protein
MGRTWALGLAAAGLLLGAGGCSQSGSYRLSWVFLVNGATESSAVACGQHGVDSILANGTDDGGNALQVITLCVPGSFTGTAQPGNWTFTFQMLDAEGLAVRPVNPPLNSPMAIPPQPAVSKGPLSIAVGAPPAEFSVQLTPPPACNDGIDNDGDGRVDTRAECDAGTTGVPDSGTSGAHDSGPPADGAPQEGGAPNGGDGGDAGPQDGSALDARG